MSAPVREPDGSSQDGRADHASDTPPPPEPDPNPAGAPPKVEVAIQSAAPEPAEPPWTRSRQHAVFAGDVAIMELRNKLALAPERVPDPPQPSTGPGHRLGRGLASVAVVIVVGVIGYQLGSAPPASPPQLAPSASQSNQQPLASVRSVPPTYLDSPSLDSDSPAARPAQPAEPAPASPAAAGAIMPSNGQKSGDAASARVVSPQLTIGPVPSQRADEAAPLTVSAADAGDKATVVIGGLAPGSALSAGTPVGPNTWLLAVEDLAGAAVTPPQGFVGAMDLTLELHLADNSVADRKGLQLAWSGQGAPAPPATSQLRQHDAVEIARMVKSGVELMANGDVAGARLMYQRAAESGDMVAAFALAETYDPLVLRKLSANWGITPNVALAQAWYRKAKDLGSVAAPERLERLARLPE